jgi:5'-nucleotidase
VPGIAVSHYIARGRSIDWSRASRWAREVLVHLMARPWQPGTFWNVNLPHLSPEDPDPEIIFCILDSSPLPLSYQVEEGQAVYAGDYQTRARQVHSDIDVCFGGRIAVTLIRVAGHSTP